MLVQRRRKGVARIIWEHGQGGRDRRLRQGSRDGRTEVEGQG